MNQNEMEMDDKRNGIDLVYRLVRDGSYIAGAGG